jgi:hypothetical protein
VLELSRQFEVALVLVDGETPVPWPRPTRFSAPGRNGTDHAFLAWLGDRTLVTHATPGRFLVEIPEIAGFEPHPPVEVELGPGAPAEVVVRLVRAR